MSEFKFDPEQSIIVCRAEIVGPKLGISIKMAVDTGATYTMIPTEFAVAAGCNPFRSQHKIEVTMGSSVEYVPIIIIPKFKAFGNEIKNMEVVCHNLPPQSPVEGLLGLNFLKKAKVIIDFSKKTIIVPE